MSSKLPVKTLRNLSNWDELLYNQVQNDSFGGKKPKFISMLIGSELSATDQERDLEVLEDSLMKMLIQCVGVVKKTNSTLRIKGIENK